MGNRRLSPSPTPGRAECELWIFELEERCSGNQPVPPSQALPAEFDDESGDSQLTPRDPVSLDMLDQLQRLMDRESATAPWLYDALNIAYKLGKRTGWRPYKGRMRTGHKIKVGGGIGGRRKSAKATALDKEVKEKAAGCRETHQYHRARASTRWLAKYLAKEINVPVNTIRAREGELILVES